jgi:hypothetical protein
MQHYIFDDADWDLYRNLAVVSKDMVEKNSIDQAVQFVTDTIIYAADVSIRKSSGRSRRQTRPWWNQECKKTYKDKRKAFSTFKRYPTDENYTNYKKCKAIFKRTLRQSQRDSWRNYVNSISSTTSSKHFWDKIRRCSGI